MSHSLGAVAISYLYQRSPGLCHGVHCCSSLRRRLPCLPGSILTRRPGYTWQGPDCVAELVKAMGMAFNPRKCKILQVSRGNPSSHFYQLCGKFLQEMSEAKYLSVLISDDISWDKHISGLTRRANYTLGLLHRNLRHCPRATPRPQLIFYWSDSSWIIAHLFGTPTSITTNPNSKRSTSRLHALCATGPTPAITLVSPSCWGMTWGGPHWRPRDTNWGLFFSIRSTTSWSQYHPPNFAH